MSRSAAGSACGEPGQERRRFDERHGDDRPRRSVHAETARGERRNTGSQPLGMQQRVRCPYRCPARQARPSAASRDEFAVAQVSARRALRHRGREGSAQGARRRLRAFRRHRPLPRARTRAADAGLCPRFELHDALWRSHHQHVQLVAPGRELRRDPHLSASRHPDLRHGDRGAVRGRRLRRHRGRLRPHRLRRRANQRAPCRSRAGSRRKAGRQRSSASTRSSSTSTSWSS